MSYQDSGGRVVEQKGQNGAAYVIVVGENGLPSAGLDAVIAQLKVPTYAAVTNLILTTSTTAAAYVAFPSQACEAIDIMNDTGSAIEYVRNGAGNPYPIPNGASHFIPGITNANQISFRVKGTAAAVVVSGMALKV